MSTFSVPGTTIPAIWHPQSFSDLHERLKSDPRGVSADLDTTLQFLALRTQSSSTDITNIINIISGKGTVNSVGLAMPSIFSVSGSPVTDTGTLTATLVSQLQNLVWASPDGAPGLPTFRALVAGDIPALPYLPSTTVLAQTFSAISHQFLKDYDALTGLFTAAAIASADLPVATVSAVGAVKPDGSTITIAVDGTISSVGGGTPGGANTDVQYNDSGAMGGDAGLTYDKTNNLLTITNTLNAAIKNCLLLHNNGSGSATGSAIQDFWGAQIQFPFGAPGYGLGSSAKPIVLVPNASGPAAGVFQFRTDGAFEFGGTTTPSFSTIVNNATLTFNQQVGTGGGIVFQTGGFLKFIQWNGSSFAERLRINALTNPNWNLSFGTPSATVPALKPNSTTLEIKLADDSAYTDAKANSFQQGAGPTWSSGSGTPEGVVTAPIGSLFSRTDGGAGTSLYVKESGTGNTGWVGK